MCGIAGFCRTAKTLYPDAHRTWVTAMGESIRHRGPDAGAVFLDEGVALAHRRLSILDLSDEGNQPMVSASGRYVIVFNGEIYNFQSLRMELESEGVRFHSRSDTEVLLALFEKQGAECLHELNGMFAVAIWDREERALFLARDRLGKKPLYYYHADGQFVFASELKALIEMPLVKREIRPDAVKDFFAYQYIPDPKTIYQNTYKLEPGHWLKTDGTSVQVAKYWDVSFSNISSRSQGQIEDELYGLIDDAVHLRMVSDVPLGAFLSGGVDSSAVVGLMASHADQAVTTCAIGFDSKKFDEVQYARQVASQFQTSHYEFTVKERVADSLPYIARFFDEPFADPSFVPTFFVSQLARQEVTVALAGDGGDENFAGYSKYRTDAVENRLRSLFPLPIRRSLFPMLASVAAGVPGRLGGKAQTLCQTLMRPADEGFYLTNCFFRPWLWDQLVNDSFRKSTDDYDPADTTRRHFEAADTEDHLSRILYTDIKTYLPGDILVKVDRMSMANSLETRAPLLDYRVVEYAATIPSALKLRQKEKKYILKKAFSRMLPDDILYRKKMGFSVPLASWLRHELYPVANRLLTDQDGGLSYCFKMSRVAELWQAHINGDDRYTQELWSMVVFGLWWQRYAPC
ncbi:asparagine synthase (glutamine-hydrolyzing) [Marinobacter sp. LN3S78]|uniref:asparagine synthase (glutamine-hydrolyzing) n=1 Tax=Marinobacter sp. LN3S78 TaxID=3382300 RepID=UPI00387B84FE